MEESYIERTLYRNSVLIKRQAPCPQANQAETPLLHC